MRNPRGWHIRDLHLERAGVGLSLFYEDSFDNEHILIEDLVLEDIDFGNHLGNGQADNNAWDAGICVSGVLAEEGKGRTVVRDLTVRDIILKNVCNGFNVGFGNCQELLTNQLIRDLRIFNVDSFGGRSCGVHVRCTTGALIQGCDAFGCGKTVNVGTCSAFIHDSNDVVWQDCELGYTAAPNSPDGIAFDFEGRNEGVMLRRSLLHDNVSSAILFYNGFFKATGFNRDCIVEDCVIFNNAQGPVRFYGGSLLFRHCRVYVASRALKDAFLSLANSNKGVTLEECAVSVIGEEHNGPNLAENARISVSSSVIKPDALSDGDPGTFWQPEPNKINDSWIELSLSRMTRINKLFINETTSEIARFVIRYWDEKSGTWQDAFHGRQISGNTRFIPVVPILTTRLRFVVLKTKSAAPRVSEISAYCVTYDWDESR